MTLTKSLFTAGQQCHKLLWWKVHEPGAVELQPDKVLQDRFDQGAQVGALARDEFPPGVAVFERAFETKDVRIRADPSSLRSSGQAHIRIKADVLLPDGDGWRLIEVKSASSQIVAGRIITMRPPSSSGRLVTGCSSSPGRFPRCAPAS